MCLDTKKNPHVSHVGTPRAPPAGSLWKCVWIAFGGPSGVSKRTTFPNRIKSRLPNGLHSQTQSKHTTKHITNTHSKSRYQTHSQTDYVPKHTTKLPTKLTFYFLHIPNLVRTRLSQSYPTFSEWGQNPIYYGSFFLLLLLPHFSYYSC